MSTERRRVWVRRPGSTATSVMVGPEDLIAMVLQKYPQSLGKSCDPADLQVKHITAATSSTTPSSVDPIKSMDHRSSASAAVGHSNSESPPFYKVFSRHRRQMPSLSSRPASAPEIPVVHMNTNYTGVSLAPDCVVVKFLDRYYPSGMPVRDALIVEGPATSSTKEDSNFQANPSSEVFQEEPLQSAENLANEQPRDCLSPGRDLYARKSMTSVAPVPSPVSNCSEQNIVTSTSRRVNSPRDKYSFGMNKTSPLNSFSLSVPTSATAMTHGVSSNPTTPHFPNFPHHARGMNNQMSSNRSSSSDSPLGVLLLPRQLMNQSNHQLGREESSVVTSRDTILHNPISHSAPNDHVTTDAQVLESHKDYEFTKKHQYSISDSNLYPGVTDNSSEQQTEQVQPQSTHSHEHNSDAREPSSRLVSRKDNLTQRSTPDLRAHRSLDSGAHWHPNRMENKLVNGNVLPNYAQPFDTSTISSNLSETRQSPPIDPGIMSNKPENGLDPFPTSSLPTSVPDVNMCDKEAPPSSEEHADPVSTKPHSSTDDLKSTDDIREAHVESKTSSNVSHTENTASNSLESKPAEFGEPDKKKPLQHRKLRPFPIKITKSNAATLTSTREIASSKPIGDSTSHKTGAAAVDLDPAISGPRRSVASTKGSAKFSHNNPGPISVVPQINVLIVEDNVINQKILEAFMRKRKIRCSVAKNGREAVDKWKTGGFHLVLMDIQLPVMSGLEATKEIRRMEHENRIGVHNEKSKEPALNLPLADRLDRQLFRSPVIVVALTASSSLADKSEALAVGCNDFLTKPVNLGWLEQKTIEWGCMQALIDFEGWKNWVTLEPKDQSSTRSKGPETRKRSASKLQLRLS